MPEHQARRLVLHVEQVELPAEAPVVALFRLLQHVQVGVQILLAGPGRPIDPLQHLVAAVAPPVGPRHLGELEHLQAAGRRHVRPAAQVDEAALAIQGDLLGGRYRGNDFGLVALAD